MASYIATASFLLSTIFTALVLSQSQAQLSCTFYATNCPNVSNILCTILQQAFQSDPHIGAGLIHLHFHDCFVNECEASLLLNNNVNIQSKKDAAPT